MTEILPNTPLEWIIDKDAKRLSKHLDLTTVKELLDHFPRRYIEANALSDFGELEEGEYVTFRAMVRHKSERTLRERRKFIVEITVEDDRGNTLRMAYFNGYLARKELSAGVRALFHGKVTTFNGQLTLNNPDFEVHFRPGEGSDQSTETGFLQSGPMPLYPANRHITSWEIHRAIAQVLGSAEFGTWPDPVPASIAQAEGVPSLAQAYRMVHMPEQHRQQEQGIARFRVQEALVMQAVLHRRRQASAQSVGVPAPPKAAGLLSAFDAQLPFELTEGQQISGEMIAEDLSEQSPMNRLLQGEVGSGKTLVALRAMLQVVDAGAQAALIAPTEVLAAQHYRSLRRALGALAAEEKLKVTLLTGSMRTAERKQALLDIASGQAGIVIGTHALLGQNVHFARLGLVVVDEQHRFGVEQRSALRQRYDPTPHMLIMSATPIPRSVAMTVFGDLELTILEGLPGGRTPTQTHLVPLVRGPAWIGRVWQRVAEQVAAGHQAYVVCPKISIRERSGKELDRQLEFRFGLTAGQPESTLGSPGGQRQPITRETAEAFVAQDASVELIVQKLEENQQLDGVRIGALHGQLSAEEASATMAQFEAGEIDVLVATTVIEVGVDVPNATTMVILDAESFGVSTLHQLRGRIGRGETHTNLCLLVTRMPEDHPSVERLRDVAETNDGMELAQLDLARRREGDVLGASQSGTVSSLQHLSILRDEKLITRAAEHIQSLALEDPTLESTPELARAAQYWEQEYHDAASYVDQG